MILFPKENPHGPDNQSPAYVPTPEEIAETAAEIRKGWSLEEHYKRAGLPLPQPYEVPTVELAPVEDHTQGEE